MTQIKLTDTEKREACINMLMWLKEHSDKLGLGSPDLVHDRRLNTSQTLVEQLQGGASEYTAMYFLAALDTIFNWQVKLDDTDAPLSKVYQAFIDKSAFAHEPSAEVCDAIDSYLDLTPWYRKLEKRAFDSDWLETSVLNQLPTELLSSFTNYALGRYYRLFCMAPTKIKRVYPEAIQKGINAGLFSRSGAFDYAC